MAQRICANVALLLVMMFTAAPSGISQAELQTVFRHDVGLSKDQIAAIRSGQPVAKNLPSRTPAEVFLFGAIYIRATPQSYIRFASDVNRLRKRPYTQELEMFSNPPKPSDLKNFSFDSDDVQALRRCQPGDCLIQMPAKSIEDFKRSINWSAADVDEQVNQLVRMKALQHLLAYQRMGNQALDVYDDKRDPTDVAQQFAYLLSYSKALPEHLPDFYHYLLAYPNAKSASIEDTFYWARLKFGLKPTVRVVHMVTMRGSTADQIACAIAEKQLYSSHYFETELDLSFCVRGSDDPAHPGFYLIMAKGSEQAGLTGRVGAIVRKVAVDRSIVNLRETLSTIKNTVEANP
jgi:hypothetical protein